MKKAIIITENKYPNGDAGAVRQHVFAKMFEELGYSASILGYGECTDKKFKEYDGIRYISFRTKSTNRFVRFVNRIIFGLRINYYLKHNAKNVEVIMVIDTLPYAFKLIKKFADKHDILLLHDSVEWYSPEEYSNGKRNIQYRLKEKTNCSIIGAGWRVVAISKYLYNHFSKKVDRVVRIPAVMDVVNIPFTTQTENKKTKFVYAGAPGLKDYLKDIIDGFGLLPREILDEVELHIIGVSKNQLCKECGVSSENVEALNNSLYVYGRIKREDVILKLMDADYTVLIRNSNLRYAKAGFPTKIVESLACGTPPMCNFSSDLVDYLRDGENAVIIDDFNSNSIRDAVLRAISYKENKKNIRTNARITAEKFFDYRRYVKTFSELLSK